MNAPDPLPAARAQLASESLEERCAGVACLANVAGAEATALLASLLEESSWWLRARVADVLAQRRDAAEALLAVLRGGSWFARASACEALGKRGAVAAIPALLEQVEDRNVSLQKAAGEALRELARAQEDGLMQIARTVAALEAGRRRRVLARIDHQLPAWSVELERTLATLDATAFNSEDRSAAVATATSAAARGQAGTLGTESAAASETALLVSFRQWIAGERGEAN